MATTSKASQVVGGGSIQTRPQIKSHAIVIGVIRKRSKCQGSGRFMNAQELRRSMKMDGWTMIIIGRLWPAEGRMQRKGASRRVGPVGKTREHVGQRQYLCLVMVA